MNPALDQHGPADLEWERFLDEINAYDPERAAAEEAYWERMANQQAIDTLGDFA